MIGRSNKFSFWIGSIILWFAKLEDRCKVISKIFAVGEVTRILFFQVENSIISKLFFFLQLEKLQIEFVTFVIFVLLFIGFC